MIYTVAIYKNIIYLKESKIIVGRGLSIWRSTNAIQDIWMSDLRGIELPDENEYTCVHEMQKPMLAVYTSRIQ